MPEYDKVLQAIAEEISGLKLEFPQLAEFSPSAHLTIANLTLSYGFHTHRATQRGGWTAGVPNPDDDGVWFHLDFHDEESQAQIHTQPCVPSATLGDKIVWLLILEGAKTKPLAGRIWAILERHGATR